MTPFESGEADATRDLDLAERRDVHERMAAEALEDDLPEVGSSLGRYQLEEQVAVGGMGAIYRAHDLRLSRTVAVKVVRRGVALALDENGGRPRLEREARAIAQLAHPNIISVFDVEVIDGHALIAMEYFEGEPLNVWASAASVNLERILRAVEAAAGALGSAHRAGIVHRDVKPANIIVSEGGDVRVVDFGLARSGMEGASRLLSQRVTLRGIRLGTPRYMAPETANDAQTEASDQYSLAAVLYEMIYGDAPAPGCRPAAHGRGSRRGPRVPSALRRSLRRALASDPADRHRSVVAFAHSLARVRGRTRRRLAWAAAASVAAVGIFAAMGGEAPGTCDRIAEREAPEWGDEQRHRVAVAFEGSGQAYWRESLASVDEGISTYLEGWRAMRRGLCDDAGSGRRPGREAELALACLGRGAAAGAALIERLEAAGPGDVRESVAAIEALPRIHDCEDAATLALMSPPPAPGADVAEISRIRSRLVKMRAARLGGDPRAETALRSLRDEVRGLDYGVLRAEVLLEHARALGDADRHGETEATLRLAITEAERAGDRATRAHASLALAYELGHEQKRFEAGREALENARALVETMESPTLHRAVTRGRADLYLANSKPELALPLYEELALDAASMIERSELESKMGESAYDQGHAEVATQHLEAAVAQREALFGRSHPAVAESLTHLGRALGRERRFAEAQGVLDRALRIALDGVGPESPLAGRVQAALAGVHHRAARYEDSASRYERAIAIAEAQPQPIMFDVAIMVTSLGVSYSNLGRQQDAIAAHRRAMRLLEASVGPRHPRVAMPLMNLASSHRRAGEPAAAIRYLDDALSMIENDGLRNYLRFERADMLDAVGRVEEARAEYEKFLPLEMNRFRYFAQMGIAEQDLRVGGTERTLASLKTACPAMAQLPRDRAHASRCMFALARAQAAEGERSAARTTAAEALERLEAGGTYDELRMAEALRAWGRAADVLD